MNQQQKPSKILLIGDGCYDEYCYGTVNRLNPEAPVPVLDWDTTIRKLGMAGNVLQNFQALGLDCHYDILYKETKKRYIDSKTGQQIIMVDVPLVEEEHDEHRLHTFNDYDAVVISDYDKGYVTNFLIRSILESYDGPVFIDTKKQNLELFNKAFVKINQYEYENRTSDADKMIVTYGSEKVTYKDKVYFPPKVDAHDVCGAGDTFLAAVVYSYLETGSIEKAIEFAMKASAVTVQHVGVYAPRLEEIKHAA
jgi:bifunctional ADP-heptose synthase (sugar kinase/adenylyltransferase)